MIAGNTAAIDRAMDLLKASGAKRVVKLNVSAPFHCALMLPAQKRLAEDLEKLEFGDLQMPLVTNVQAVAIRWGSETREALIQQVSSPVRWQELAEVLIHEGVDTMVEVGPGKVLSGLMRQISRDVECFNVEDSASLEAVRGNFAAS